MSFAGPIHHHGRAGHAPYLILYRQLPETKSTHRVDGTTWFQKFQYAGDQYTANLPVANRAHESPSMIIVTLLWVHSFGRNLEIRLREFKQKFAHSWQPI